MSRYSTLTGIILGAMALVYFASTGEPVAVQRAPASYKLAHLNHDAGVFKHTSKLHGPLEISLVPVTETYKVGEPFQLKAVITAHHNLESVDVVFSVPEGMFVQSGAIKTTLNFIQAGQPQEVDLIVQSFNPNNEQIHVKASARQGKTKFSQAAQYNTIAEAQLRSEKSELIKRAHDYESQRQKRKIVF